MSIQHPSGCSTQAMDLKALACSSTEFGQFDIPRLPGRVSCAAFIAAQLIWFVWNYSVVIWTSRGESGAVKFQTRVKFLRSSRGSKVRGLPWGWRGFCRWRWWRRRGPWRRAGAWWAAGRGAAPRSCCAPTPPCRWARLLTAPPLARAPPPSAPPPRPPTPPAAMHTLLIEGIVLLSHNVERAAQGNCSDLSPYLDTLCTRQPSVAKVLLLQKGHNAFQACHVKSKNYSCDLLLLC